MTGCPAPSADCRGLLLRVEEDRTWDAEMLHGTEVVDYLAIEGDGVLTAEAAESETWYYYFAGQRVAMREGGVLFFIVGDPTQRIGQAT